MITKLSSSKEVLAKIISDYNLQENDIRIADIKNWIAEGMENIGSVNNLNHIVVVLPIKDYQCKLPCDLQQLSYVAYSNNPNNGWVPIKKATGVFSVYDKKCCDSDCNMLIQNDALIPLVKNMFNIVDDKEALDKLKADPNIRKTLSALINQYTVCDANHIPNKCNLIQYDVKPGYIFTNVRDGFLKISYYAIYTDEEGMPMIPDMQSYKEALTYYVGTKLLYPDWIAGKVSNYVYESIKNSWNFYRNQAYAESLMPTQNELHNIGHTWLTLVPNVNTYDTFTGELGDEQYIYNWN